jgi:hypothetical protein
MTYLLNLRAHAQIIFTKEPRYGYVMVSSIRQRVDKAKTTMVSKQTLGNGQCFFFGEAVEAQSCSRLEVGVFEPTVLFSISPVHINRI